MGEKKDLIFYLNDINKYIEEIKSSGLDILDEKKFNEYLNILNTFKQKWKDEVLPVETGPNIISKTLIILPIEDLIFEFRKYMTYIGKQKLRDKNSNEVKLIFESIKNKEIDLDDTIKLMSALKDHVNNNLSKYNDIEDYISISIYQVFKNYYLNRAINCTFISSSIFEIIRKELLCDLKTILNEKYETKEKQNIQDKIRIVYTLNSSNVYKLFNLMLSIYCDKPILKPEEKETTCNYDLFYKDLLEDICKLRKENHGLFTYSLIFLYNSKKEVIDNDEYVLKLRTLKKDIEEYKSIKEKGQKLTNKMVLIKDIDTANKHINNSFLDNYNSEFDKCIINQYIRFENYKEDMINSVVVDSNKYMETQKTTIMFANLIINGFYDESIIENKAKICIEMEKLLKSEVDLITLWKLNSYICLLFRKNISYINLTNNFINLYNPINNDAADNVKYVNAFFCEMILLYPILNKDDFKNEFIKQLCSTIDLLSKSEINSFGPVEITLKKQKNKIDTFKDYGNHSNIYEDGSIFNEYYKDFLSINDRVSSKQVPFKTTVKLKALQTNNN
jgi:hypothetical protein